AAPKLPSMRCRRCRAGVRASTTFGFAARKKQRASSRRPRAWGRASWSSASPGHPPALAQVDDPPPLLYVKGRLELAEMPIVAVVGARERFSYPHDRTWG